MNMMNNHLVLVFSLTHSLDQLLKPIIRQGLPNPPVFHQNCQLLSVFSSCVPLEVGDEGTSGSSSVCCSMSWFPEHEWLGTEFMVTVAVPS